MHFTVEPTVFGSGGQRPQSYRTITVWPISSVMIEAVKHGIVQIILRRKTRHVVTARSIVSTSVNRTQNSGALSGLGMVRVEARDVARGPVGVVATVAVGRCGFGNV